MFHERQGFDDGDAIASERVALAGLILALRTRGIRDRRILSAIELIPRRLFLPVNQHSVAYDDKALPIEYGQLIAQRDVDAEDRKRHDLHSDGEGIADDHVGCGLDQRHAAGLGHARFLDRRAGVVAASASVIRLAVRPVALDWLHQARE